jgi:small-conductance mechanosensitive channel
LLAGISSLGIAGLQQQISEFFLFLPRFFVALFMIFLGLLAADFFARAALLAAVNSEMPSPQLISDVVRVVIIVLAVSMTFEELGLASKTILIAFAVVSGALMLGLAIAFGLGGQDLARQFLERRFTDSRAREKKADLPPL